MNSAVSLAIDPMIDSSRWERCSFDSILRGRYLPSSVFFLSISRLLRSSFYDGKNFSMGERKYKPVHSFRIHSIYHAIWYLSDYSSR